MGQVLAECWTTELSPEGPGRGEEQLTFSVRHWGTGHLFRTSTRTGITPSGGAVGVACVGCLCGQMYFNARDD